MQRHHEKSFDNKSKVQITFSVDVNNYNPKDLEEILHEFAALSHGFYLQLGRELNNKLL